jgi:hypothetical protein
VFKPCELGRYGCGMVDGLAQRRSAIRGPHTDCVRTSLPRASAAGGCESATSWIAARLILFTETRMMLITLLLAGLTFGGLMSPVPLLILTFALSATALNSTSRAMGPTLAGIHVSVVGHATTTLLAILLQTGTDFDPCRGQILRPAR